MSIEDVKITLEDLAEKYPKWKNYAAISAIAVGTWFEWYWVWSLLFLFWAWQSVDSGEAYIVEPVTKEEDPQLFSLILITWVLLAVLFASDLIL